MDTQALQLHDKVQKLIEQYTKDKKKMAEMEADIISKDKDLEDLCTQNDTLKSDIKTLEEQLKHLEATKAELTKRLDDSTNMLSTLEGFAADINTRIDDLIPQIEKL